MTNFELHLTTAPLAAKELTHFAEVCRQLKTKPLFIELARGKYLQQPMATAHFECEINQVLALGEQLSGYFADKSYPIERLKIEAPLNALPLNTKIVENSPRYLEWHGKVKLHNKEALLALCQHFGSHLSRNSINGETDLRFVSIRHPLGGKGEFFDFIKQFTDSLEAEGWPLVKQQFEHCLYDSKELLDKGWLSED